LFLEKLFHFVEWNHLLLAAVIEIAMRGTGDDEQLLHIRVLFLIFQLGISLFHFREISLVDLKKIFIFATRNHFKKEKEI
jgi:hypothetical protein